MRPDDTPIPTSDPRGTVAPPARDYDKQHQAVAAMTREQINTIYQQQSEPSNDQTISEDATQAPSAYSHQHTAHPTAQASNWQHYHSAWQDYYQKYYERYYMNEVHRSNQVFQAHAVKLQEKASQISSSSQSEDISQDEALYDLRSQLLGKVKRSAKKVRKSRHFIPAISAICVVILFAFLQYNSIIFSYAQAYVTPGSISPDDIIVDPNLSLKVGPEPRLIIPKINVNISVDYNAKTDYDSQMASMENNVAYFGIAGANSRPGQLGNTPMAGHSSNDFTASGNAKFIFARLEQMEEGDTFYLNYNGTRYTYNITTIKVVSPKDVRSLQIGSDKPYATLITCTPLGTATNRLLVIGEQVSPAPSDASSAPAQNSGSSNAEMAGTSPTVLERAFGAH